MNSGFFQLINVETGKVICQREGFQGEDENIRNKVWLVQSPNKLVFVTESDYCHPNKFFNAMQNDQIVKLYDDEICHLASMDLEPTWVGKAKDVEAELGSSGKYSTFTALSDSNEWVGTSEY